MSSKAKIEELLDTLEKNADELRSGELSVDESVKLYEESLKLYDKASKILNETKQKIEIYDPQKDITEEFDELQL